MAFSSPSFLFAFLPAFFLVYFVIPALSTGRFLAMLPWSLVRVAGGTLDIKILPVKLAVWPPRVGIATLKNRTMSPVTQRFIESCRAIANPLIEKK